MPSVAAPSLNVTVPVGVPPLPATVAVNVTDCPNTDGFAEDTTVVVVEACVTVCVRVEEVLPVKFASPLYVAVIECGPNVNDDVANVATPLPFSVPVPSVATPSLNVTVPIAVPDPEPEAVTVAVKVTDCPTADGFPLDTTEVVVAA